MVVRTKHVFVVGAFNKCEQFKNILEQKEKRFWYTETTAARVDVEYRFQLSIWMMTGERLLTCKRCLCEKVFCSKTLIYFE